MHITGRIAVWKLFSFILLLMAIGASVAFSVHSKDPVFVETVAVEQGAISTTIDLTGRVINDQTVTLTALLDGELIGINAREGNVVKAGGVLATLDNRHALALRNKARAELAYQQEVSKSARTNYNRIKKVSNEGNTSRQAMDDSLIKLRSAEAQLKVAESELEISELRLENAEIIAPFDGTVIEQTVETGQWVEAGTKLFTLVASDGDVIETQVDAGDSSLVKLGQAVTVTSDAWPGKNWESAVSWIAPAVTRENNSPTNTFAVRLHTGDDAPRLMLGEQLDVALITEKLEDILLLPIQSLTEVAPGEYRVYMIDDSVARERVVEIGVQSINQAQILNGLNEGDAVILPAGTPIQDGMSVAVR